MLYVHSIKNSKKHDADIWLIARKVKYLSPGMLHVPELSPPQGLLQDYWRWRDEGCWDHASFLAKYVPRFLQHLHHDRAANQKLLELASAAMHGDVCIACFCPDETLCHRSIIAGMMQGLKVPVVTETGNDYTPYFKYYIENIASN